MGKMLRKSAVDPGSLKDFTRKDFNWKEGIDMTLNKKIADAASKKGFYGPQSYNELGRRNANYG